MTEELHEILEQQNIQDMESLRAPVLTDIEDTVLPITDFQTGKAAPDKNSIAIITAKLALEALGNKVCVVEDEFRTGYECSTCGGTGKVVSVINKDVTRTCETCGGKGGLLIAPDNAKRRPSTGRVVSKGPEVKRIDVGDYILYTNFAGTAITFKNVGVLRIMAENEVIGRMYSVQEVQFGQAAV